ncbi:MAG: TonB-dependent receptor plug domain-containing protein [Burkholderiales bacterium]|nr:TonB-dependent receptor plug domain-containing protein [Burkholderiales bacterium]
MRKQLPVYLMSSSSVLAALTAKPAPAADTLDFVEQETQVFAASRYVQTLAQTPANVTIISADELRRFGFRTISEALQTLPGVYDAASQWPGLGFRGVAIPGDFGSRILYLINGMPIYEPTYGGFFIEHLDIATIMRIEVVRGPGSALYGSGAVLAVVNLVTRTGHDYPNARLWGEAGSHGFRKGYASISGVSASGVDGFASVSANERDGRDFYLREYDSPLTNNGLSIGNDAGDGSRFFGRLSRQMSRGQTWLQAHYVEQDRSDLLASYSTVFNTDRLRLDEWFASVEAGTQQYLFGGQVTARGYYQGFSETGDYPYNRNVPQTGGLIQFLDATDFRSDQFGAELRYERGFASGSRLLGGLEVKRIETHHVDGETSGPFRDGTVDVDRRPRYNLYSLFFQDEIPVGASGTLFLGGRYNSTKIFRRRFARALARAWPTSTNFPNSPPASWSTARRFVRRQFTSPCFRTANRQPTRYGEIRI